MDRERQVIRDQPISVINWTDRYEPTLGNSGISGNSGYSGDPGRRIYHGPARPEVTPISHHDNRNPQDQQRQRMAPPSVLGTDLGMLNMTNFDYLDNPDCVNTVYSSSEHGTITDFAVSGGGANFQNNNQNANMARHGPSRPQSHSSNYIHIDNIVPAADDGFIYKNVSQTNRISNSILEIHRDGQDFLRYLSITKRLQINQDIDICCALTKCVGQVKFTMLDGEGNILFYGCETSNWFSRQLCSTRRSHILNIKDRKGRIMMKIERGFDWSVFWGLIAPDRIEVHFPSYEIIGFVQQRFSLSPSYNIMNSLQQTTMTLEGPWIHSTCFANQTVEFNFNDLHQRTVGKLIKQWSGCGKECLTNADNFAIDFPSGANPHDKALCLASLTLVNIRHYDDGLVSRILRNFILFLMFVSFLTQMNKGNENNHQNDMNID